MTRKIAKSARFSALVALIVLMVLGAEEVFADNTVQIELDNFGELLDGVTSQVLATPIQLDQNVEQSSIPRAELFVSQIAYLEAFEEVIQNNIL